MPTHRPDTELDRSRRYELLTVAIVVFVTLGLLLVRAQPGSSLAGLDRPLIDQALQMREDKPVDTSAVAVILLDDDSLARLGERWPLRRSTWAHFLRALMQYEPAVVAVDAWFEAPEPSFEVDLALDLADKLRLSGLAAEGVGMQLADGLDQMADALDGDLQLTRALAESGRTLLGMVCAQHELTGHPALGVVDAQPLELEGTPPPRERCAELIGNHSSIALAARGQAGLFIARDGDGRVRRYPYVLGVGDQLYPALATSAVLLAHPEVGRLGLERVVHRDGGAPLLSAIPPESIDTVPFVDVLRTAEGNPALDDIFRDRIVFVGVSAQGATDLVHGALGGGGMPGVYLHANAALDLLSGRHLITDGPAGWFGLLVGGGLLLVGAAASLRLVSAPQISLVGIGVIGAWAIIGYSAVSLGWIVPAVITGAGMVGWIGVRLGFAWFRVDRERAFIRQTFGQYVSREVVDAIIADQEVKLGGEERVVTVLFSDLRGYSTILEKLSPAEAVALINEYLGEMAVIVDEHRGTVLEFIGDAILAVFNAPMDVEDHALQAVRCAAAMRERLAELNRGWEQSGMDRMWRDVGMDALAERIGIHTGSVVAGNLGSRTHMKYGVIGDNVNVAARLEALNKKLGTEILVSGDAWRLIPEGAVEGTPRGSFSVKGRDQEVEVWSV